MGFLRNTLNAVSRLHSSPATLRRGATPELYSPIRITPSNYSRLLQGPSSSVIEGHEFLIPVDTIIGTVVRKIKFNPAPTSGSFDLSYNGSDPALTCAAGGSGSNVVTIGAGPDYPLADHGNAATVSADWNSAGSFVVTYNPSSADVTVPATAGVTQGDFFVFQTADGFWVYIWLDIDNAGTAVPDTSDQGYAENPNAFAIRVPIATGNTGAQNAAAFQTAVSSDSNWISHGISSTHTGGSGTSSTDIQTYLRAIAGLELVTVTGDFSIGFTITFINVPSVLDLSAVPTDGDEIDAAISITGSGNPFPSPAIKRGDKIITTQFGSLAIVEVIPVPDLGGDTMAYRVRCE